jgi:hypothetical protein
LPILADGIFYENCILRNLFRQISVYINGTLVSTSNNLSNYKSHTQFMLMILKSYKELRGTSNVYKYINNTNSTDALKNAATSELHLVRKIYHDISNIPQWLPPNIKVDIKMTLAPSNFILRKELAANPDVTLSLTSAILNLRTQQVMSSVALAVEPVEIILNCLFLIQ